MLAPFAVFAKIIAAERLIPDALGWAALGTILVAGIYALAIRLDANYLETAVRVSRQMQERKRRAVSDGIFALQSKRAVRSSRLPQPPWLGGVGPLVWRQVIQALRGSRGALLLAVIVVVAMGAPLAFGARGTMNCRRSCRTLIIGMAAYVTFLFSAQAPLGFRGDYERMDLLKSLPIRPLAMACGQTLVVVMILTLLQWLVFAATAVFVPAAAAELLVAGPVCPALQLDRLRHGELPLPALSLPACRNRLGRLLEDGPRHALHAGQVPRARRLQSPWRRSRRRSSIS